MRLVHELEEKILAQGGEFHLSDPAPAACSEPVTVIPSRLEMTRTTPTSCSLRRRYLLQIAGHLLDPKEKSRSGGSNRGDLHGARDGAFPYSLLRARHRRPQMPFGGLIEHTNYIPRETLWWGHRLYISNYLFPDYPLYNSPKSRVIEISCRPSPG